MNTLYIYISEDDGARYIFVQQRNAFGNGSFQQTGTITGNGQKAWIGSCWKLPSEKNPFNVNIDILVD